MFGPLLDKSAKDDEVYKAGVYVCDSIGALEVIVEMMKFLYDVVF